MPFELEHGKPFDPLKTKLKCHIAANSRPFYGGNKLLVHIIYLYKDINYPLCKEPIVSYTHIYIYVYI